MSITAQKEVGIVTGLKSGLVSIEGLPTAKVNDVLTDSEGTQSLVVAFDDDGVEAILLGETGYRSGDVLSKDPKGIQIPIGPQILGRIINPLGVPIDGAGPFSEDATPLVLEVVAPGVAHRALVEEQLYTGITVLDLLIPIGKGQREAVFGEADSGKEIFLRDTIAAQKGKGIVCIYAAIGQPSVKVKRFVDLLNESDSMGHTVIVAAPAGGSTAHVIVAPSIAMLIASKFREQGQDALVIWDDLGTHAKYARELALLSRRVPGRESYPGDIFYQHAHLIEQAGSYNESVGEATISLLPVLELGMEAMSTLVPTNIMASTDGHLYFSGELWSQGVYPAVEIERSVTRVGRRTQVPTQIAVSDKIRSLLAQYRRLERFSHLGAEISGSAQQTLHQGAVVLELLKQESGSPIDWRVQVVLLGLAFLSSIEDFSPGEIGEKKEELIEKLGANEELLALVEQLGQDEPFEKLIEALEKNDPLKSA